MFSLASDLLALGAREADEIVARFPKVQRRVGGYNLDALLPGRNDLNLAHILIGSEGTLGFTTKVELKLAPLLGRRAVGACHFGRFYDAMDAAQHIVRLKPIGVELIDRTMIELAREIAMFRPTLEQFVRGDPDAILLVEFGEDDQDENLRRLKQLTELMGDLGYGFDKAGAKQGGVVEVLDPSLQAAITDVRTSGLNIMMSMKDEGKPVSFVEDCAVPLEHLAEYTSRLTEVFEKNGTRGTWYAHAGAGCLHVRPVLNLRLDKDVKAMRAIAEEAFAMVRDYKGSHSGEHGDGIVRSEFHEFMFGKRLVRAFEEVKARFDPKGLFNPGKIVHAPKFDDRENFRFGPGYRGEPMETQLDWSAWPGAGGGFQGAVEMCNNNGACRKIEGGVMCPSYRVTRDERDVTRGRANSLRLAITGQLGPDALTSDEMAETMKLCVSCKACRRECPTGVDMARMKIEVMAARAARFGFSLRDRLVGWLPRYAPYAAAYPWLLNARNVVPGAAWLSEMIAGFSARRSLPEWRRDVFRDDDSLSNSLPPCGGGLGRGVDETADASVIPPSRPPSAGDLPRKGEGEEGDVVLFADTFNRYFERENLDAAFSVLRAAGYRVQVAQPANKRERPLCCGRTFLSVGAVKQAREEANRTLAALAALHRKRRAGDRSRAELHSLFPRRDTGSAEVGCREQAVATRAYLRGIPRARARGRPPDPETQSSEAARARSWPLPSEIFRGVRAGSDGARPRAGPEGRADRIELLRDVGRLRLCRRHHRCIARDGRIVAVAGCAQGAARRHHGRRRHLLPAPDSRRHRTPGAACRARAGKMSG